VQGTLEKNKTRSGV